MITPQLVRDAALLTVFLSADSARIRPWIPHGLELHPNARLILNMWSQPAEDENTGFGGYGAMSVTYLAIEVTGPEGASADGRVRFPARVWLKHWCSFEPARRFAAAVSGLAIEPGETSMSFENDRLQARLSVDQRVCIEARARVADRPGATLSGHSVYYGARPSAQASGVARFEVPWVADPFDATDPAITFSFPASHAASALLGDEAPRIAGVMYRRITLVPYIAQGVLASPAPKG